MSAKLSSPAGTDSSPAGSRFSLAALFLRRANAQGTAGRGGRLRRVRLAGAICRRARGARRANACTQVGRRVAWYGGGEGPQPSSAAHVLALGPWARSFSTNNRRSLTSCACPLRTPSRPFSPKSDAPAGADSSGRTAQGLGLRRAGDARALGDRIGPAPWRGLARSPVAWLLGRTHRGRGSGRRGARTRGRRAGRARRLRAQRSGAR